MESLVKSGHCPASLPQPYEPDPEEEMLIPKQFRLVEAGGEWHAEFDAKIKRRIS
jgi:hypothetical protein